MEDFRLDIVDDELPLSKEIPYFTMVGATTAMGSMSEEFYSRFTLRLELQEYSDEEMAKIAELHIDNANVEEIIKYCRGVPRIIKHHCEWIDTYCRSHNIPANKENIKKAMEQISIYEDGLTDADLLYIKTLKKAPGKFFGLKTISSITGIKAATIENTVEPHLLRLGLIQKGTKGRRYVG